MIWACANQTSTDRFKVGTNAPTRREHQHVLTYVGRGRVCLNIQMGLGTKLSLNIQI